MKLAYQLVLLVAAVVFVGCGAVNEDPEIIAQRAKFLLNDEPAGAQGVLDTRAAAADLANLVVVGRVGSADEAFEKGKATFVITDPSVDHDHGDGSGHDPENCPFCKARKSEKAADPTAIVELKGSDGQVLPVDARELLRIREGQLVVVQGTGAVNSIGSLVINASGVFVRE